MYVGQRQGKFNSWFSILYLGLLGLNVNLGNKKEKLEPYLLAEPLTMLTAKSAILVWWGFPPPNIDWFWWRWRCDQFDLEQTPPPDTPVDTHGVKPWYRWWWCSWLQRQRKNHSTYCQPVDADGVGKCPCPEGCAAAVPECSVLLGALPNVSFAPNSNVLSKDAQSALANAASE